MPLLLTPDDDLETIELPHPGEWVKVKRVLGNDDVHRRSRILLNSRSVAPGESVEALEFGIGDMVDAARFATMEVAIKAWSFDAEITPRTIRALDDQSIDVITARFEELYPAERTDDDRKNSASSGQTQSSDADGHPQNSAG